MLPSQPGRYRSRFRTGVVYLFRRSLLRSQVLTVNRVINPADHHLFPGLIAPADGGGWVGIEFVVGGIVVVRDAFYAAAFGHGNRFLGQRAEFPVAIVLWLALPRFPPLALRLSGAIKIF